MNQTKRPYLRLRVPKWRDPPAYDMDKIYRFLLLSRTHRLQYDSTATARLRENLPTSPSPFSGSDSEMHCVLDMFAYGKLDMLGGAELDMFACASLDMHDGSCVVDERREKPGDINRPREPCSPIALAQPNHRLPKGNHRTRSARISHRRQTVHRTRFAPFARYPILRANSRFSLRRAVNGSTTAWSEAVWRR